MLYIINNYILEINKNNDDKYNDLNNFENQFILDKEINKINKGKEEIRQKIKKKRNKITNTNL